jgi:ABC-type transport system involved in multi-copper enzyme maturation permease subunit
MKYFALLKDSIVETLDRKSLYVVLILSGLLILLCASIGFRRLSAPETLGHVVRNFQIISKSADHGRVRIKTGATYEATHVESKEKDHTFTLKASPLREFHKAVLTWKAVQKGTVKDDDDPVEGVHADKVSDPGPDDEVRFLRSQFRSEMIMSADIEPIASDPDSRSFKVELSNPRYVALEGGYETTFLFGVWSARIPFSVAIILAFMEYLVATWIAGIFGVILAVIFTAGFVPGMLQKGTLDLVLAKPVRRPLVLLTKYFGGLFYVLIPATVLIGGCWLVISWRSGYFNYGFLMSIVVLVTVFAVLYSFAVLIGVLTRSTIATILLTVGLWFFSWLVAKGNIVFNRGILDAPPAVGKAFEKTRLFLPRTTEWGDVATYYIVVGNLGPELRALLAAREEDFELEEPNFWSLGLSSGGFIIVMLGLACWVFSRRDY